MRLRRSLLVMAIGVSIGPISRALAHGSAPAALSIVRDDAPAPKLVRLSAGLAWREDRERYRFLCPAAWGDDLMLPAVAIPDGPSVIAAGSGLFVLEDSGALQRHPDPLAAGPSTDLVTLGDQLFLLRTRGASSELLVVDAAQVRVVFSDPEPWSTIAATSQWIGLQRLNGERLEQLRLAADGGEIGRESAPVPSRTGLVTARATANALYALLLTDRGRELGQIEPERWIGLASSLASIAGPVELPGGASFVALDQLLVRFDSPLSLLPVEGAPAISCLGRSGDRAYACTREGVVALAEEGPGEPAFDLRSLVPPELTRLDDEQRLLCESQWEHFRFDLATEGLADDAALAGGVPVDDAGGLGDAGGTDAGLQRMASDADGGEARGRADDGCAASGLADPELGWMNWPTWLVGLGFARWARRRGAGSRAATRSR